MLWIILCCSQYDFSLDDTKDIVEKLYSATPEKFAKIFNYQEKVNILLSLVNSTHELQSFREHINERITEWADISKLKNEAYQAIKEAEAE